MFTIHPSQLVQRDDYIELERGTCGVMNTAVQVQILDKAVCISNSANTFGESMNPTNLP